MDLNLFKNLKENIMSNSNVEKFMEELTNCLKNDKTPENEEINNEQKLQENRKEGHLYLVTEDRNGEIYLWDFTDKPKHEFKEVISSEELLNIAKEGTMLQYRNGKYELYSQYGYDMLEKNE